MRLEVDAGGASVAMDCASGRITGPIELTPSGAFAVVGTFEEHQGGPQPADTPPRLQDARFSGQIRGDQMTFSILPAGAAKPQTFNLRKGATVKLVRCL